MLSSGDETLDLLIFLMSTHKLYALALSEVRLDGQGEVSLPNGYILVYAGAGASGGVAFLLSPAAVKAWRATGSAFDFAPSGRMLRLSFQVAGGEGVWHLFSVYGPTLQCDNTTKAQFWTDIRDQLSKLSRRDVTYMVGDWNCRVGTQLGASPDIIGPNGLGQRNTNGDLLLQLASEKRAPLA